MKDSIEAVVFDVGHGACVLIKTPNERTILVDPGCTDKFSPAQHLHDNWETDDVDMLVVTHPHGDHINDMVNVDQLLKVHSLLRNKTLTDDMICPGGDKAPEADRIYLQKYHNKLIHLRAHDVSMMNLDYNGGVTIISSSLNYDPYNSADDNDLSQAIRFQYGQLDLLCPGDLGPDGVAALAKKKPGLFEVKNPQSAYRILIAPHHGRKSGISMQLIELFQPDLTIICDEFGVEYTKADFYHAHSIGMPVYVKFKSNYETKKVLTTKTNDYVYIRSDNNGCFVQIP